MRDRLSIQDQFSIRIVRGEPESFTVMRPITEDLKIPKDLRYPYMRYDTHIEFYVTAHSIDEAESLLNIWLS